MREPEDISSKKYLWHLEANPLIGIEQQMMDRLAIEIRDEIDKTILEAMGVKRESPVKDGIK